MSKQETLFDYTVRKMKERGIVSFYGKTKTPKDVVNSGTRTLSSAAATSLRSQAFAKKDVLQMLNSPTYCTPVDAYVPFWWAVEHYPEAMFADWDKRMNMAAGLQKQQYNFQTLAQLYLSGATGKDVEGLADPETYMELNGPEA